MARPMQQRTVKKVLAAKADGLTTSQIATRTGISERKVRLIIDTTPSQAIVALAPASPEPEADATGDGVEVIAATARPTSALEVMRRTQPHLLQAVEMAAQAVTESLRDRDVRGAQVASIVAGICIDQVEKMRRMMRDLQADAQEDIEAGWDIVVRPDDDDEEDVAVNA